MKLAIMQPYFFPYIGYFQLIAAADVFIIYDNIKYTKKGWINRNRILLNGTDTALTLPLKSGSDSLDVRDREIAADFRSDKLLNQIKGAYERAPFFRETMPLIEKIMTYSDRNLFGFLHHSVSQTCKHLAIETEIRVSSDVMIDHELKNQSKVLALCAATGADTYINASGGTELYSKELFQAAGVDLKFIKTLDLQYTQFGESFVPWLSIVDVLMFNSLDVVRGWVGTHFELT